MAHASSSAQFIQVTYARWGQVPNSNSRTYWKIESDGSVLFETHSQLRETGDYKTKTWRLDPSPTWFSEIEHILKPAQVFIGKECQSYPTVAMHWIVQWAPGETKLELHAACLDAWAKEVYRMIYAANEQIVLWMRQSYPDFDNGHMQPGKQLDETARLPDLP